MVLGFELREMLYHLSHASSPEPTDWHDFMGFSRLSEKQEAIFRSCQDACRRVRLFLTASSGRLCYVFNIDSGVTLCEQILCVHIS
jgi:hypothetical protein